MTPALLRPQYRAAGRAGDLAGSVGDLAVDDRMGNAARRHHHPLRAAGQVEASLAAARRADRRRVEDRDVGGIALLDTAAALDAEEVGWLRSQPSDGLLQRHDLPLAHPGAEEVGGVTR